MKHTFRVNGIEREIVWALPIVFDEDVHETIDMETVIIVLTMPKNDFVTSNRIYGVKDGKIAWRVQDMLEYNENCAPVLPDPYTGIRVYDKNESLIIATTFNGFRMLIDPQTGKIVGEESWVR